MDLTKHAQKRKRQRGFTRLMLEIIERYGCYRKAPHGGIEIFFGKKESGNRIGELKREIQLVERLSGSKIIFSDDEIITIYKSSA